MSPKDRPKAFRFRRTSKPHWVVFEDQLRQAANVGSRELDLAFRLMRAGSLFHDPGVMKPLDGGVFQLYKLNPAIFKFFQTLWAGPYTVNFQNGLTFPVQFVWAYEL